MPRSKNKVASRAKRKKVLDMAKGNFGRRKNVYTVAKNTVEKGLQHAYTGRKLKKREFRGLWIQRINAAARLNGVSYSVLMSQLKKANIESGPQGLAEIALHGCRSRLHGHREQSEVRASYEYSSMKRGR
jgi:large subunit ribosomal protein L20